MRVVMLCNWPKKDICGGVHSHTIELVKSLGQADDVELSVVSYADETVLSTYERTRFSFIRSRKIYYFLPILALLRLSHEVNKLNPDIVHIQGCNLSPYSLYCISFGIRKKCILTIHGLSAKELLAKDELSDKSIIYRILLFLEKKTIKRADLLILVNKNKKDEIKSHYGIDIEYKSRIIPNGIDLDNFSSEKVEQDIIIHLRRNHAIPDNGAVIFHAKSFDTYNGQEYLVRAMPDILSKRPDTWLLLAGDGPLRSRIVNIIEELGIEDRVYLLGNIPRADIIKYLASADIVVMPSVQSYGAEEGSSLFLIESMAMSKPVIATCVGGNVDTILSGINGFIIPERDPKAISEKVLLILADYSLAKKLGINAREYVKANRSVQSMGNGTIEAYKKLLSREFVE